EGIIHRDLKPANLMIVDPGTSFELLKVMDFGLAKLLLPDPRNPPAVTNTEFAVGTPGYMCPEQARGEEMDGRGDLYSVAVILYEWLTGRQPFAGKSTMDVLLAHAPEEPPSFARIGAAGVVAPAIEKVVRSCLAKQRDERPPTARDLAERFEAALLPPAEAVWAQFMRPAGRVNGRSGRLPATSAASAPSQPGLPPTPSAAPPTVPVPAVAPPDPSTVVQHLEAWMPE